MFDPALLLAFIAAATVLTITPGVDTAMVLRSAASDGARSAIFAGTGIMLGCLVWAAAVAVGLGALLQASELAYAVIKFAGAAYLIYLGVKLVFRPRTALNTAAGDNRAAGVAALGRGFMTNILNPKVGVFYVTFLPQFIPQGANVAVWSFLLACIHVGLSLVWFALLIAATAPLGRLLRKPGVVTALDRLTGGVFILFGLKLAVSRA
ncbi:LysE family translocator [Brevundimonas sp.]|jgi:threonine/homoserine/homoserine lactone efflux protein|uniref:LysE family translocator n=1 Tax=Brevundimonas sp. TaxID=1871086 RepID=UPI0037C05031